MKNNRVRTQVIRVGQSNNLEAEVLSGLSPEDDVVNYPSDKFAMVLSFHENEER